MTECVVTLIAVFEVFEEKPVPVTLSPPQIQH